MTTPPPDRAALIEAMARAIDSDAFDREQDPDAPEYVTRRIDARQLAKAVLDAIKAAGCVVVPREPTDDMIGAACMDGVRAARSGQSLEGQVRTIHSAMVSHSPYRQEA